MSVGSSGGAEHALRAVIDRDECFGFAVCVATVPQVFHLDADGISVAADVDADPALLDAAVDGCPRGAISLIQVAAAGESPPR